ncbi:P2X purinoceptor 7 [Austrofundulus limnaeus]|uniref:P2X purinoceptor 7 n=1 Tax=Austrofundulus limnaeus TaxID=52670 RepID=A0A2I4AL23_AUSLI|nr:PREDICTED: P2X purinoceptor 7-like [Austrofundulus limnaeus]
MAHSPSLDTVSMGSDDEFTPRGTSRIRRRGSRLRGASGRTRGRRRGRRLGSTSDDLNREDMARVDRLRMERTAYERDLIQHLDLQQTQQVLEQCLARDPSMIFDVLCYFRPASPSTIPPVPGQPSWCICHRCREMPTVVERKCCTQQPHLCISTLPHMEAYILHAGVLRLARRIWNDLRAVVDLADDGEDNRQFRHAAYRQFVAWQCGTLGPGHRVVIPSCCVWVIRDRYPDPQGQYRGFIPRRV